MSKDPESILAGLAAMPTAPFHEEAPAAWILRYCQAHSLRCRVEHWGLLVEPGRAHRHASVVFLAHLDHPGFSVRSVRGREARLEILGGVPDICRGARVRVFGFDGGSQLGRVARRGSMARNGRRVIPVRLSGRVATVAGPARFAMWDLVPIRWAGRRAYGRALDDLAGCAAILAALARLNGSPRPPAVRAVFTRAEEVGFVGAGAAMRDGAIPRSAVVVSVETSRWRPGATIGDGPIVRLGDRSGLFDSGLTAALLRVAESLGRRVPGFCYQRALLDGGTCEATALLAAGYRATGLACPLGNYHNQAIDRPGWGAGRGVAPEFIDRGDWCGLVRLIEEAALRLPQEAARGRDVRRRLASVFRRNRSRLRGGPA